MYGRADENEAVIRLTIDAILLETMASLKGVEYDQHGEETTTPRKSPQMSLENPITYVYNTVEGKRQVTGRVDYTLWYGKQNEAETNLMVVEAKAVGEVPAGRYQAISYMGELTIRHHRNWWDDSVLMSYTSACSGRAQKGRPGQDPNLWNRN